MILSGSTADPSYFRMNYSLNMNFANSYIYSSIIPDWNQKAIVVGGLNSYPFSFLNAVTS